MNRRDFIKNTAATTASVVTVANGVTLTTYASANDKPVTNEKRWGMLIDTNKLTEADIDGMVVACKEEHGWGNEPNSNEAQKGNWIRKVKVQDKATGRISALPLMCQHCEEPPCVDVCPTNASMKREDGIVLVDRHRCIGCRYCMMACPYDADLLFMKHSLIRKKTCQEAKVVWSLAPCVCIELIRVKNLLV